MLKRKVDNGATRAITQFFFDNDLYERYVERVRRAGIYIPIVPGILPVHNFTQVANFSARCGAHVPAWLAERFDGLQNDPQTHALVASAVAAEQVLDLVERGVGDFHFYTMNRADLAFAICHMIGIRAPAAKASVRRGRARLRRNAKRPGMIARPFRISSPFRWFPSSWPVWPLRKNSHYEGADKSKRSANHQCIDWPCQSHA